MPINFFTPFDKAVSDGHKQLSALSASGRKVLGYFCTYTPVEIIHAAGFIPVRISGGAGRVDKANAHLPDFICPFMKISLEKTLSGQYDFLSGLVQGYSCDAACGLTNIWKDIFKDKFFYQIPIPYNDNAESRKFFQTAVKEFIDRLNTMGGRVTDLSLGNSIEIYSQIRKLQIKLYEHRHNWRLPISASAMMTIIDAGFILPAEDYLQYLTKFMDDLSENGAEEAGGVPILISGSLIEGQGILDIIESAGGRIVADDLCNGFRMIYPSAGQGAAPLDRLIDRYIKRFPCPSRSRASSRSLEILELVKRSKAKGVIFVLQKFCTPHLADYPALSEELKKNGIPSLLIEMDESWKMEAQIKTRLETFFEMLGSKKIF